MESLKRRSLLPIAAGLLLVGANCESQALPARPTPAYASQNHPVDELATRVLQCPADMEGNPSPGQGWFVFYAVDSMTRKLRSYPSLAEYAGLNSVSSCAEAKIYAQAYDDYSQRHPNFEDSPDPKGTADEAKSMESQRLPRLKIRGGERNDYYEDYLTNKVSPIVEIVSVYWLANSSAGKFRNAAGELIDEFCEKMTICTGTFINKNSLLTAAHCMQNVMKRSVSKNIGPPPPGYTNPYCANGANGQPYLDPLPANTTGQSSWLVMWPAGQPSGVDATRDSSPRNSDWQDTYMGTPIVGLRAYQHPHPSFDPSTLRRDLAILAFDEISHPEAFFPPDMARQGGTVYIKASLSNPHTGEQDYSIAGYGFSEDANGNPTPGDDDSLKWAPATMDICWNNDFAEGNFIDTVGIGPCKGDSGGPLFKRFDAIDGRPPRIVEYGVLSYTDPPPAANDERHCAKLNSTSYWGRLEENDEVIDWISQQIGEFRAFSTRYPRCKMPPLSLGLGVVWQCWGDPCGGIDDLKCSDPLQSCKGAGDPKKECSVCPNKTCDCVVGECVPDYGKIKAAHDRKEAGL